MNIKPISFSGTFYINRNDLSQKKMKKILSKQRELELEFDYCSFRYADDLYVHLPHENDFKLSKLLSKLDIGHKRMSESDVLSESNIVSRIVLSDDAECRGCSLVTINAKKLDEQLRKNTYQYVGKAGSNGSYAKYDRFKKFLMTNQKIEAPLVYLMEQNNKTVSTSIYDGRHRFAVLRDMGLSNIPVAMDEESVILAKEIGLL